MLKITKVSHTSWDGKNNGIDFPRPPPQKIIYILKITKEWAKKQKQDKTLKQDGQSSFTQHVAEQQNWDWCTAQCSNLLSRGSMQGRVSWAKGLPASLTEHYQGATSGKAIPAPTSNTVAIGFCKEKNQAMGERETKLCLLHEIEELFKTVEIFVVKEIHHVNSSSFSILVIEYISFQKFLTILPF